MPTIKERREHEGKIPGAGLHQAPEPPRHSGGTSGNLSIPGYTPKTPIITGPQTHVPFAPTAKGKAAEERYGLHHHKFATVVAAERSPYKAIAAKNYHDTAIQDLLSRTVETGADGRPLTEAIKIPKLKDSSSLAKFNEARKRLHSVLDAAQAEGADRDELKRAKLLGSAVITKENFDLTPQGQIKYETRHKPILRVSEEELEKRVKEINHESDEILYGLKAWTPASPHHAKPKHEDEGFLGDAINEITSSPLATAVKAINPVLWANSDEIDKAAKDVEAPVHHFAAKLLSSALSGRGINPAPIQEGSTGIPIIDGLENGRKTMLQGIRTGILAGASSLANPGLAIQQEIAHGLGGGGGLNPSNYGLLPQIGKAVLSDKQREELSKAPSFGETLLHGFKTPGLITGGQVTQDLLGAKQLGLPYELLTDPLSYFTLAGVPAEFAEKSHALLARISEAAPEALQDPALLNRLASANKSGSYETFFKELESVGKDYNLLPGEKGLRGGLRGNPALGKGPGEKEAMKAVSAAKKLSAEKLGKEVAQGSIDYPGLQASPEALKHVVRDTLKFGDERQLAPGLRVEFRPLMLKHVGNIDLHLPERFANAKVIPLLGGSMFAEGRSAMTIRDLRKAQSDEQISRDYAPQLMKAHENVDAALAEGGPGAANLKAAERKLKDLNVEFENAKSDARLAVDEKGVKGQSLSEWTTKLNLKRQAHELWRVPRGLGNTMQGNAFDTIKHTLDGLDKQGRARVGMAMLLEGETGAGPQLMDELGLTEKERGAVEHYRATMDEMAHFGLETGTLSTTVEDYFYRHNVKGDDPFATLKQTEDSTKYRKRGSGDGAGYSQHRNMAESLAQSDPNMIAKQIRAASDGKVSIARAREIAEFGHKFAKTRFAMEDLAHSLQRGAVIHESELTDLEKRAYTEATHLESNGVKLPSLFQDLASTDGILKLSDKGREAHNLTDLSALEALAPRERLRTLVSSANESLDSIERGLKMAGNKDVKEHYAELLTRRKAEVKDLEQQLFSQDDHVLPKDLTNQNRPQRDEKGRFVKADHNMSNEIRTEPPPRVVDGAEAPTVEEAGLANDKELGDFVPDASEEYLGTLKDFREEHPREFAIIDPLLSGFHRTRAENYKLVSVLRWHGMDAVHGRSALEAKGSRYILADGSSGPTGLLKPYYGDKADIEEHGWPEKPIGYENRKTNEVIPADAVSFTNRSLIPVGDAFMDPITGTEYQRARMFSQEGGEDALEDAIGKDRLWPKKLITNAHSEFMRMGEGGMSDLYDSGVEAGWRKIKSLQRYGVTVLFPGFTARNLISDGLLSIMADPAVLAHPLTNTKAFLDIVSHGKVKLGLPGTDWEFKIPGTSTTIASDGKIAVPGIGRMDTADFLGMIKQLDLHSSQSYREFAQLAERGDVKEMERFFSKHFAQSAVEHAKGGFGLGPSGAVGHRMLEFTRRVQDAPRAVTFLQAMRTSDGDFAESMWKTIQAHYDYADLTSSERRTLRNVFLFYTWYRKNIPHQLMLLVSKPGMFAGLTSAYVDTATGEAPWNVNWSKINPILPNMSGKLPLSGIVPDYLFNQLSAIATSWNGHAVAVGFGAPWSDMNMITNLMTEPTGEIRSGVGMLNPELSVLAELAFKKDTLTGADLGGYEESGTANVLDFMSKELGVPFIQHDENGNAVLPWAANVLANLVPGFNRASGFARTKSTSADSGKLAKYFGSGSVGNLITGLNVYASPQKGSVKADEQYINRVIGRAQQRKTFAEEGEGRSKAEMAEFDRETREWSKELGIPYKYLKVVPGIGPAYETQEEREGFKLPSGGGIAEGGSNAGILGGGSSSVLGGALQEPKKEYKSQSEEAIEKLANPGKFNVGRTPKTLTGGISIQEKESNALTRGEASAKPAEINRALKALAANAEAEQGKGTGKPEKPARSRPAAPPGPSEAKNQPSNPTKKVQTPKVHAASSKAVNELAKANTGDPATDIISSKKSLQPKTKNPPAKLKLPNVGSEHVARTVLETGKEMGASPLELLAAAVTGMDESGFRNLKYGDADSRGWRQERSSIYAHPNNVKEGAENFFNEAKEELKANPNLKADELAHAVQGNADPGVYTKFLPEGEELLKKWGSGGSEPKFKIYTVHQQAHAAIHFAENMVGTQEGSARQQHWAAESGVSASAPWCGVFVAAAMKRLGLTPPENPAASWNWTGWKDGEKVGRDISKAKYGDIIVFGDPSQEGSYADHIGFYKGEGTMISGNWSNEVGIDEGVTNAGDSSGQPIQQIIRPKYSGKNVRVKVANTPSVEAVGRGSSEGAPGSTATEGVSGAVVPGKTTKATEAQERRKIKRIGATASGKSSVSLTDSGVLGGSGAKLPAVLHALADQLEANGKLPSTKAPTRKYNLSKHGKL